MKKWILIGAGALLVLLLIIPITNLIVGPPDGVTLVPEATADPALQGAANVLERKCVACHTTEAELPFYANFPIAYDMITEDIEDGTREMDLLAAFRNASDEPVGEVVLAKIEHSLDDGSMPPTKYLALHWDGGLSGDEEAALRSWIEGVRAANYATKGVSPELAKNVLQPLPTTVDFDARKAALGEKLYHDVRLSGDDSLSCASCHALDKGGCDQAPVSTGIRGQKGPINSPTVFNSRYSLAQFWDGRAADLKEQAGGPVNNPGEMGSSWPKVIGKLSKDEPFVAAFTAVYPDGLSGANIQDAIAEFERSLVTPNSAFDRFLQGDESALTDAQKAGLERFLAMGCATCHVGKAMGGQSYERMGRDRPYFTGKTDDADLGRFNVTKIEADRHRFKVPTLRNVALTFPYFHDAQARDLSDAVRTMAAVQHDVDLTAGETAEIVAFLESLTGEWRGKPLK